jgi:excisionase family DNA binding protein
MENTKILVTAPEGTHPVKKRTRKTDRKLATPDLLGTRLFLRVNEYSSLTGTPAPTVYSLVAAGKIPGVVRIGNSIRIPTSALTELVA